ncbi:MAG: hypothetical protein JW870_11205 [Candidatus Delongbacteria bacterium]|nr:hypothetical protein [Candidatus Delongbacteria bacterium]
MRKILFILAVLLSSLYCSEIPSWVVDIPDKPGIDFSVGVSDIFLEDSLSYKIAYENALYQLLAQEKVYIYIKKIDLIGTQHFYTYDVQIPDYNNLDKINNDIEVLATYSDQRYYYILIGTGKYKVKCDLVNLPSEFKRPLNTSYPDIIYGFGIANARSSQAFFYATADARIDVCEQLHTKVSSMTLDFTDVNSNIQILTESEMIITNLKITGYFVDYQNNLVYAKVRFKKK